MHDIFGDSFWGPQFDTAAVGDSDAFVELYVDESGTEFFGGAVPVATWDDAFGSEFGAAADAASVSLFGHTITFPLEEAAAATPAMTHQDAFLTHDWVRHWHVDLLGA